MLVRDLVIQAIELREDQALARFADKRGKSFDKSKALTHKEVCIFSQSGELQILQDRQPF